MIRIEFIFSRFKSILLGASGEGFRKQTKEGKSLFTLRGLVSCDANKSSSELPLVCASRWEKRRTRALKFCSIISSIRSSTRNRRSLCGYLFWSTVQRGAWQQKRRTLRARWSSKARSAAIAMSDETAARVMS